MDQTSRADYGAPAPAAKVPPAETTRADYGQAPAAPPQTPGQTPADTTRADYGPAPQSQQSTHLPGGLLPAVQSGVDAEAKQRGMPPQYLRAIARLESGGQPDPATTTSPAGAQGVMQLMPDTFKEVSPHGNIISMRDNIAAGATYYGTLLKKYGDPVKAAGAYNVGPGAMDAYLAGKRSLPAETVAYMANFAAMNTPIDKNPLPPIIQHQLGPNAVHGPVQTAYYKTPTRRLPGQQHSNLDPVKAKHEWYDQMFGAVDAGYIAMNAGMADISLPGSKHVQDAARLWAHDPAAASAEYGPNARGQLIIQSEISDEQIKKYPQLGFVKANARAMLANPTLAAGETAIEEFFNPLAWGQGEVAGRVLGYVGKLSQATVAGRYLTHIASPFKGIVARHGENARNGLAQVGAHVAQADKTADAIRHTVFDGLTQSQQWEVVRQSQGLAPNVAHAAEAALIKPRAVALRADIVKRSAAKLAAKVLTSTQVKDVNTYFPMRGAHTNPNYDAETMSFLDELRPGMGAPTTAESTHFAKYDNVDDAHAAGTFDPNEVNAATQYFKHVKAGEQNIAWENGMRTLAEKHPDMIRFGAKNGEGKFFKAPLDKDGRQMINLVQAGIHTSSPALQDAWVSREFAAFLGHGKSGAAASATLSGVATNELFNVSNIVQKVNKAQRAAIFSGPSGILYHQFNNLAPNAAAAVKAGLGGTVRNYGRALVGAAFSVGDFAKMIPGPAGGAAKVTLEALEKQFFVGSQQYAQGIAKAIAAGAEAHFGQGLESPLGGDAIRLLSLSKEELTTPEKIDRFIAEAANWQTHAVFGKRGEGQYVSELFKHFTEKMGMEPEDAAWQTRAALGPYQDVNPDSWMSKLILFYPWLKGNGAHWVLNFLANPKLPRAQVEAFHRYNEEMGDPRANDPMNRRNPSQLYQGQDEQGREVTRTVPFPWRLAEQAGNVVAPGGGDFNSRFAQAAQIIESRLKVVPSVLSSEVGTLANQKANPQGTYTGLVQSAYDKNDPGWTQAREAAMSAIERTGLYPSPMLVQDMVQNGYDQTKLKDYVQELFGAGVITRGQSSEVKRAFKRAAAKETVGFSKLYKIMQGPSPLSQEEYEARRQKVIDKYNADVQRKKEYLQKMQERKQKTTTSNPYGTSRSDYGPTTSRSDYK